MDAELTVSRVAPTSRADREEASVPLAQITTCSTVVNKRPPACLSVPGPSPQEAAFASAHSRWKQCGQRGLLSSPGVSQLWRVTHKRRNGRSQWRYPKDHKRVHTETACGRPRRLEGGVPWWPAADEQIGQWVCPCRGTVNRPKHNDALSLLQQRRARTASAR